MPLMSHHLPFILSGLGLATTGAENSEVRPPAVAGQFYPKSEAVLRGAVQAFLADARPPLSQVPLAIVVPHAGYIYSGQICADGWNQARNAMPETIVLLGTNHTTPGLAKVALYPGAGFRTPLGTMAADQSLLAALAESSPDCVLDKGPHVREHSLEVQVPFAQVLFPEAKLLAAVVGSSEIDFCDRFGATLAKALAGRRALIVASSDLSHYPAARDAEAVDRQTLEAVATLDPKRLQAVIRDHERRRIANLDTSACGEAPIMVAMAAAKSLGAKGGRVISYAHSGDVPIGERDRVVGYGAVVFAADLAPGQQAAHEEESAAPGGEVPPGDQQALLKLVRKTIGQFLTTQTVPLPRDFGPVAREERGAFVTLKKKDGCLRGCIGRMVPDRPLAALIGAMALQSAFEDPRFCRVTAEELPDLRIEISVLTPMKPVSGPEEIVVGRDGVLLQKGRCSAVFLPQVATEQGWGLEEMLSHLSMKACLPANGWRQGASFSTFQAQVFGEEE